MPRSRSTPQEPLALEPAAEAVEPQVSDAEEDGGDESSGLRLNVSVEEKLTVAAEVTSKLFGLLGYRVPGVDCRVEEDQIVVQLHDLDPAVTASGDTRVLESVQFILNKAINRYALRRTRLSLDAEGFRRRRPEGLDKVAQALAEKVQRLGKPMAIGPIGQGDLRFLSTWLTRGGQVQVHAVGGPAMRRLVVEPQLAAPADGDAGEGASDKDAGRRGRRRRRR